MWLAPLTTPAAYSSASACPAASVFAALVAAIVTNGLNDAKAKAKETRDVVEGDYDFVVVGGGSAGCVVASRLSEETSWRVLLLEAGAEETDFDMVPAFYNTYLKDAFFDWQYSTLKSGWDSGGSTGRGRGLGGSSAINAMHWTRGNRADFDRWKALGNTGWGYEDVLPFFKKSENMLDPEIARDTKYHGTGGLQDVELNRHLDSNTQFLMDAYREIGFDKVDDVNGPNQLGVSEAPSATSHGERRSSNRAFLTAAVRKRPNLTVQTSAVVRRVVVSGGRAVAVEYDGPAGRRTVRARREVVLSAGAYNSPQILMLSGIGPKQHLQDVGVAVVADVPGVGQRLHDHMGASGSVKFLLNKTANTGDAKQYAAAVEEYVHKRTGPLAQTGNPANLFFRSRYQDAGDQRPDVQVPIGGVLSFSKLPTACAAPDAAGTFFSRLSFGALNLHPKSRGQVLLNKTDPYGMPLIYNNVFGVASDVKPVIEAYKLAVKLNSTRAFRDNGITVTVGAPKACAQLPFNSDEYWLCSFQGRGKANQHPTSTCSMGPDSDAMAVVSPRLKVRGVSGLRVIDASVMPEATSGNTNAVCVMIGERGSDLIKQDHKQA